MKFFKVASVAEARDSIKKLFSTLELSSERVSLRQAVGRRAYADILADEMLPEYNRSTVDGYAVCAASTYGATDSVPSMLRLMGRVEMGKVGAARISAGEAVYVPTGGEVPEGADAVVMLEYVGEFGDSVAVYRPVSVRENVIFAGDDVERGDILLGAGEVITPLKCGLLAALGVNEVEVFRRARVAIISTGDEIVGINETKQIGQIRDTNTIINAALCEESDFEVTKEIRIKDGYKLLDDAVSEAEAAADVVLVSGGSSIGTRDYTQQVFENRGKILIHGIAMKPGKPTIIASVGGKPAIGLPGHPMACLLVLKLLVLDTVREMYSERGGKFILAKTTVNFPSSPGRLTVQPVSLDFSSNAPLATPIFYKSGLVSVIAHADGYTLIPENAEGIDRDTEIKVYLI